MYFQARESDFPTDIDIVELYDDDVSVHDDYFTGGRMYFIWN